MLSPGTAQRATVKTTPATIAPSAPPAIIWAGVWSLKVTRAQAVRATSDASAVSGNPSTMTRITTASATAAMWIEIFQKAVTSSALASPAMHATTSASRIGNGTEYVAERGRGKHEPDLSDGQVAASSVSVTRSLGTTFILACTHLARICADTRPLCVYSPVPSGAYTQWKVMR